MSKLITLSQEVFDKKLQEAIEVQPIRKEVAIAEINIVDENFIEYEGQKIPCTKKAFYDITDCLKIPKAFIKRFEETFGAEGKRTLLNRIKDAQGASRGLMVTLIVNPQERKVMRVLGRGRGIISNESFGTFATRYIDQYNLEVSDFHVAADGSINMNTIAPNGRVSVPGMEKEHFYTGVSFTNSSDTGLQVSPYLHRLICSNGMVTRGFQEEYRLKSLDPKKVDEFNEQMLVLCNNNFIPAGLTERIQSAHSTPASLSEMQKIASSLMTFSKISYNDLQKYVPIESTNQAFARWGIDTAKMTRHQLQNAKTGTSVWQLINGMTNFASNHKGDELDDYNRSTLMIRSGELLTKKQFDTENLVLSPFDHAQPDMGDN